MRMALLAERIAAEAHEWGLVTAVYPADEFDAEVDKVISTLVSGPAVALRKTKHAINATTLTELEGALERESQASWRCWKPTISARAPRRSRSAERELHRLPDRPSARG